MSENKGRRPAGRPRASCPVSGIILEQIRKYLGLTQADLAKLIGVKKLAVQRWERPDSRGPSNKNLENLLAYYQTRHITYEQLKNYGFPTTMLQLHGFKPSQSTTEECDFRIARPVESSPKRGGDFMDGRPRLAFSEEIGMKFVPIEPGRFWMGSAERDEDDPMRRYDHERPRHVVDITRGDYGWGRRWSRRSNTRRLWAATRALDKGDTSPASGTGHLVRGNRVLQQTNARDKLEPFYVITSYLLEGEGEEAACEGRRQLGERWLPPSNGGGVGVLLSRWQQDGLFLWRRC